MGKIAGHSSRRLTSTILAGMWALYTAAYFVFYIVFRSADEIAEADATGYLEVVLLGVPTVILFGAVIWLFEMDVEDVSNFPVLRWGGSLSLVFILATKGAIFLIETSFDPGERWLVLLLSAGLGLSLGSVTGLIQLRSVSRERERNRLFAETRRKERERKQLEYLNQALRHEVLNGTQKIDGYTALLRNHVPADSEAAAHLDIIEASSQDIAEFIQSIRHIMDITDYEPDLEPVDVVPIIEEQATLVMQESSATTELEMPDSAFVLAGDLIDRVFKNLFENAIEHNDGPVGITVTVKTGEEWVDIQVRDTGSGMPATERERLFEPPESGDHGYGLYLIRNLVELYGGTLGLVETGPDGTEFRVRLPAVSAPKTYTPEATPVTPTRSA
jgi:signal transduction histidine kinase